MWRHRRMAERRRQRRAGGLRHARAVGRRSAAVVGAAVPDINRCGRWGCRGWAAVPVDRVAWRFVPLIRGAPLGAAGRQRICSSRSTSPPTARRRGTARPRASQLLPRRTAAAGAQQTLAVGRVAPIAQAPRLVAARCGIANRRSRARVRANGPAVHALVRCGAAVGRHDGGRLLRGACGVRPRQRAQPRACSPSSSRGHASRAIVCRRGVAAAPFYASGVARGAGGADSRRQK